MTKQPTVRDIFSRIAAWGTYTEQDFTELKAIINDDIIGQDSVDSYIDGEPQYKQKDIIFNMLKKEQRQRAKAEIERRFL